LLLLLIFFSYYIQTIDHDHGLEKEYLIDQGDYTNDTWQRQPTLSSNLFHARSDTNIVINPPSPNENQITDNNTYNNSISRSRRSRSMLNATKCSPS